MNIANATEPTPMPLQPPVPETPSTEPDPRWKWDVSHVLILVTFLAGLSSAIGPMIASASKTASLASPSFLFGVAVLLVSAVTAFFKTTPKDLGAAFALGESSVPALARSVKRSRIRAAAISVASTAFIAAVLAFGVAMIAAGCTATTGQKVANVSSDALTVLACVSESIGAGDSAPVTVVKCALKDMKELEDILRQSGILSKRAAMRGMIVTDGGISLDAGGQ